MVKIKHIWENLIMETSLFLFSPVGSLATPLNLIVPKRVEIISVVIFLSLLDFACNYDK